MALHPNMMLMALTGDEFNAAYQAWADQLVAGMKVCVTRDAVAVAQGLPEASWFEGRLVRITPTRMFVVECEGRERRYHPQRGFVSQVLSEDTATAQLDGPRRQLYPLIEVVEDVEEPAQKAPLAAPGPKDYTVSVVDSPVSVETVGSKVYVISPYYYYWKTWAKKHGGKWDAKRKAWELDVKDEHAVRARLIENYGCDGTEGRVRAVDVRIDCDVIKPQDKEWEILGRKVAGVSMYGSVYAGEGVVPIKGELRNNKGEVAASAGTILEVRGVPLAKALAWGEAKQWRGVLLVKREGADAQLLDQGQRAAAQLLSAQAATDLPELKRGRRAVTAEARIRRAEDIGEFDLPETHQTWSALAADPALEPTLGLLQRALAASWEQLRGALLEQDGDWWALRAGDSQQGGRDMCYYLDQWCRVALDLEDGLSHELQLTPILLKLFIRWQADQLTRAQTPAEQLVSTADTQALMLQEAELAAASKRLPAPIPLDELDFSPVPAHDVRRLRAALGLNPLRFGEVLGCSRQRIYAWEKEGTSAAHPSVSALLRLYLPS